MHLEAVKIENGGENLSREIHYAGRLAPRALFSQRTFATRSIFAAHHVFKLLQDSKTPDLCSSGSASLKENRLRENTRSDLILIGAMPDRPD